MRFLLLLLILSTQVVFSQEKTNPFSIKAISVELSGITNINTNDKSGFMTLINNPISPWLSNNNISISVETLKNFKIGINYFSFVGDYLWLNQADSRIELKKAFFDNNRNKVISRYFDRVMINIGKSFTKNDHSMFCGLNFSRLFNGYEFILYDRSAPYFSPTPYYVGHSNYKGNGIGFSLEYRYTFFNKMYIGISNHFTYSKFQAEYFTYGNVPRIAPTENYRLSPINNTTHISFGYRFGK